MQMNVFPDQVSEASRRDERVSGFLFGVEGETTRSERNKNRKTNVR